MIVQEEFVSIQATPDVVERYLTEVALLDQWRSSLVILEPLEGDLMALNSKHRMRVKPLALTGAIYTVSERDKNHILLTIEGPWQGTELWRWFADGPRTLVLNRVEYEVPNEALRTFVVGFGTFFSRLDMRLQLLRLQQLIEGGAARRKLAAG